MGRRYKVITVVGARPHFIKVAALVKAMDVHKWHHLLVHSGQHYDEKLSGQFFREFGLEAPAYNLQIGSQVANLQISDCIRNFDRVLDIENPDLILVIGDTNTTAAAAIAAKKRNIFLGHIEAGLREFDRTIPEEINKLITDAISDLYFVPTPTALKNLAREGITQGVYLTGDISLDLLVDAGLSGKDEKQKFELELPDQYIFMTCHRAVNTDHPGNLRQILEAVSALPCPVYFSLHPRTEKAIEHYGLRTSIGDNVRMIQPLSFKATQNLIRKAFMVITDSGGVIKEAYFHRTPCMIIDRQTEWEEILEEGWAVITGPEKTRIIEVYHNFVIPRAHKMSLGNGTAAKRIIQIIETFLDAQRSKDTGTGTTH